MTGLGDSRLVAGDLALTRRGHERLLEEYRRLTEVKRPDALAALREAADVAGDMSDNSGYLQARQELDRIEERVEVLEARIGAARTLQPGDARPGVVSRGSHVVLEDLDDSSVHDYVVVASAESDPEHGRLSDESPVGLAISGHRRGDLIQARTPHRVRHLRITEVDRRRS